MQCSGTCASPDNLAVKQLDPIRFLMALALLAQGLAGCATRDVNLIQPQARTGYVDFHAEATGGLSWEVTRFDDRKQTFRVVFSEFEPPKGGFLRLAFAPGHHRLRVIIMNRPVVEPALVEVEVKDGLITPVHVELTKAGATTVETKEGSVGGTAFGRYGRRTRISSEESAMYAIAAVAGPPVAYGPKERMPYAH
jgi:hypothetical protein